MTYLYLDTETLGLDLKHDIWEIAWAFDGEPVTSMIAHHDRRRVDPEALAINNYAERMTKMPTLADSTRAEARLLNRIRKEKPYLVGANPSFDAVRLLKRWEIGHGETPWHYRMIDVSTYAMPILGHDTPQGLLAIAEELRQSSWDIALPDHSAAADVESVRDTFTALRSIARYGAKGL